MRMYFELLRDASGSPNQPYERSFAEHSQAQLDTRKAITRSLGMAKRKNPLYSSGYTPHTHAKPPPANDPPPRRGPNSKIPPPPPVGGPTVGKGRGAVPPPPDPRYVSGQDVVVPPSIGATVVIPTAAPPRQSAPVLRADPDERHYIGRPKERAPDRPLTKKELRAIRVQRDSSDGRVISVSLDPKEMPSNPRQLLPGVPNKSGMSAGTVRRVIRNKVEVLRQLAVLVTAFEEVEAYNPNRHHNQPPPALWINDPSYLQDVRSLLDEMRQLNDLLRQAHAKETPKMEKAAGIVSIGTRKFVESYCDVLGKGAAALTIGAAATLLVNVGVPKDVIADLWSHLKPGK
jgi:hypothetical protein